MCMQMFPSKGICRERAAAGQLHMSDAGSNVLVEVPIGIMPRSHLLFTMLQLGHLDVPSQACTSTLPSILRHLGPLVNGLKKGICLPGPVAMWTRRLLERPIYSFTRQTLPMLGFAIPDIP
jgi:hypothetical protein